MTQKKSNEQEILINVFTKKNNNLTRQLKIKKKNMI